MLPLHWRYVWISIKNLDSSRVLEVKVSSLNCLHYDRLLVHCYADSLINVKICPSFILHKQRHGVVLVLLVYSCFVGIKMVFIGLDLFLCVECSCQGDTHGMTCDIQSRWEQSGFRYAKTVSTCTINLHVVFQLLR